MGKDNLPSPGIAFPAGAAFRGSVPPAAAGASGESGVREPALGGSGVAGARRPAKRAGLEARPRVRAVHAVGVRRFHSNFGSLGSGVSEGVTNQSPGTGINYANHHLAMGQMTPILLKTTSPGVRGVTAASPGFPGGRHGWGQIQFKPFTLPAAPRVQSRQILTPTFTFRGPRPPLSGRERAAPVGSCPRGLLETPRGVVCFGPVWGRGCGGEGCAAPFPCSASGASIVALRREAPHPPVRRDGCKVTCIYSSYPPPQLLCATSPLCPADPFPAPPGAREVLLPFPLPGLSS